MIKKLRSWKVVTAGAAFIGSVALVLTCFFVIETSSDVKKVVDDLDARSRENQPLIKNTSRTVEILEEATSEETQARNAARTAAAVNRLDCNGQRNMQTLLNELSSQHGDVAPVIMSAECVQYFIDNPGL